MGGGGKGRKREEFRKRRQRKGRIGEGKGGTWKGEVQWERKGK